MNLVEESELKGIIKDIDFERMLNEKTLSVNKDELNHPTYGNELKMFYVLTFKSDQFLSKHSIQEIFYSKYYYFLKFVEKSKNAHGPDAGLDQQVFKLLEEGGALRNIDWGIVEDLDKKVKNEIVHPTSRTR